MEFETDFPDHASIEKYVRQARLERSRYLGDVIAGAIVAVRDAVRGYLERHPLEGNRMQWRPDVPLVKRPVAHD